MTPVEVKLKIKDLVAEVLEMEPGDLKESAQFVKDLGMDSMMALEILAGIEKRFKIVIPEDKLGQFTDLNKTAEIVLGVMSSK
jgi:acyl carrier protein